MSGWVNRTIFLSRDPKPYRWFKPDLTWLSSSWVPKAFLAKVLDDSLQPFWLWWVIIGDAGAVTGLLRMVANIDLFDSKQDWSTVVPQDLGSVSWGSSIPQSLNTQHRHNHGLLWALSHTGHQTGRLLHEGNMRSQVKISGHLGRTPLWKEDKKVNGMWYLTQNYWQSWSHSHKGIWHNNEKPQYTP